MPFIPHTDEDVKAMLDEIGVSSIEDLFDEIPAKLKLSKLNPMLSSLNEMELNRLMKQRAAQDGGMICFVGAGAYEHHIPAAVWELTSRGEFMTAYTPYQPEASQGSLQLLYEYQTMMSSLMGLDVSNASLYDGGSALAEAILMAVRLHKNKKKPRILIPMTIHPHYREVVQAIVSQQNIELVEIPFDERQGCIPVDTLNKYTNEETVALVVQQPNFFGVIEESDMLTDWAHDHQAFVIGLVNPLVMSLLKPPGEWGKKGADIACGEGQPLGVPLSSGGPYYGFLCCKQEYVRQLPGRIVGRTLDKEGKQGFVLTLQAREQHIRRAKATSNICTNQGLLVTASTIYMSLMGPEGLRRTALACYQNMSLLKEKLSTNPQIKMIFHSPHFHECVFRLPVSVDEVLQHLAKQKIQAGLSLKTFYPQLGEALLVCVTETKNESDITAFAQMLQAAVTAVSEKKTKKNENICAPLEIAILR